MPIAGFSACRLAKKPVKPALVVSTSSSPVARASLAASVAVARDRSSAGSSTMASVRPALGSAVNRPLRSAREALRAAAYMRQGRTGTAAAGRCTARSPSVKQRTHGAIPSTGRESRAGRTAISLPAASSAYGTGSATDDVRVRRCAGPASSRSAAVSAAAVSAGGASAAGVSAASVSAGGASAAGAISGRAGSRRSNSSRRPEIPASAAAGAALPSPAEGVSASAASAATASALSAFAVPAFGGAGLRGAPLGGPALRGRPQRRRPSQYRSWRHRRPDSAPPGLGRRCLGGSRLRHCRLRRHLSRCCGA